MADQPVKSSDYIVVMSTVASQTEARTIAEKLVRLRLAACISVIPGVTSYYRWGGQMQIGEELILLIKTSRERYDSVEAVIKEQHSYDLPEIIAMPVLAGESRYLGWIDECLRSEE